ncbi:hypothetical protein AMELA_G00236420 [Ameiurus melas]|uniref:tRNA (uracil(54)-C(5))-methyltransferase n=1 Tax=Ameiurus melas TaxID=219545 RepID=A0A7J5ZU41_AMEME|nr:hypothetical protein AMELA_G00236420 [Ameiurus melas]
MSGSRSRTPQGRRICRVSWWPVTPGSTRSCSAPQIPHFSSLFLPGLTNIEFHCGKAEDVFPTVLNAVVSPNVTAIVDPPRAGLHSRVILAIRRAEHLKRLVYVSCNAKAAMNNFIESVNHLLALPSPHTAPP